MENCKLEGRWETFPERHQEMISLSFISHSIDCNLWREVTIFQKLWKDQKTSFIWKQEGWVSPLRPLWSWLRRRQLQLIPVLRSPRRRRRASVPRSPSNLLPTSEKVYLPLFVQDILRIAEHFPPDFLLCQPKDRRHRSKITLLYPQPSSAYLLCIARW